MSTKTEPYRKYVAHDKISKFFIFFPEMVSIETGCDFFSWNIFLKPRQKIKNPLRSNVWSKTRKIPIKITLQFEPGNLFWVSLLMPTTLLWVYFQGCEEQLKITKIHFLKILNYAHFFNRRICYPVKHGNT